MTLQWAAEDSANWGPWLPMLEKAALVGQRICRRRGVFGADAEDFNSWARIRLVENDFAIMRKYRGDSGIDTFLAAVVANLFRDYRNHCWGKWRSSAAAKRGGPLAIALEACVYRDGMSLTAAVEHLRRGPFRQLRARDAATVLASLPRREPRSYHCASSLEMLPSEVQADTSLHEKELAAQRAVVSAALEKALAGLGAEDRLLIQLRFGEGLSVADVARALQLEQKPLYRRIPRILSTLRASPYLVAVDITELVE